MRQTKVEIYSTTVFDNCLWKYYRVGHRYFSIFKSVCWKSNCKDDNCGFMSCLKSLKSADKHLQPIPSTSNSSTNDSNNVMHFRLVIISGSPAMPTCFHKHRGAMHQLLPSPCRRSRLCCWKWFKKPLNCFLTLLRGWMAALVLRTFCRFSVPLHTYLQFELLSVSSV